MPGISSEELNQKIQEEHRWLIEHMDELINQYAGKTIAIHVDQVISVGNNFSEVYIPFIEAGWSVMPLVVKVPYADE